MLVVSDQAVCCGCCFVCYGYGLWFVMVYVMVYVMVCYGLVCYSLLWFVMDVMVTFVYVFPDVSSNNLCGCVPGCVLAMMDSSSFLTTIFSSSSYSSSSSFFLVLTLYHIFHLTNNFS